VNSITSLYNSYDILPSSNDFLNKCFWDLEHAGQQLMKLPPPAAFLTDSILKDIPINKVVFFQYDERLIYQLYNVIGNHKGSLAAHIVKKSNPWSRQRI
jgi:hypothetical protein